MFDISPVSAGLIILATTIAILLRRRFTYWARHGVKSPNYIDLRGLVGVHHEYTLGELKKYGRIYGGYMLFSKVLVVNDPDLIRDIVVKNFHIFPDHFNFNVGTTNVKYSLFFMPGDENWKRVRSIVSPAFTSGKLKAMMSHISDISDQFLNSLDHFEKKGLTVDIRKYVGAFAMDVISACAYGIRVDSINNPDHPVVVNAKKILGVDANWRMILSILAPSLSRFLKLEFFDVDAINYFDKLTNQIVSERKRMNHNEYEDKGKKRTDFIQLMLDSEKSTKDLGYDSNSDVEMDEKESTDKKPVGTLSPDELTAQGILFFIAGYDTTSAAISHAIYYLSKHKEIQQKLYKELQTVSEFSYEKLNHLKYLNAVISETLRLSPSLSRLNRECTQDFKLGDTGITIPSGTLVEFTPYSLHRDPEYWPEPEEFKPKRFIEPKHHPYAYLPFGGGQRLCIGQRFSLNEMRMCIAKLFNKYEFTLAPGFKLEYFNGSVLNSPKEVLVNIKSRNSN